jgi:hypothetical protein
VLAQDGLNDPKLRQQMNPDERQAFLNLLKTADIAKINRSDSESVRLVLSVTPQLLAVAETWNPPATATTDHHTDTSTAAPSKSKAANKKQFHENQ